MTGVFIGLLVACGIIGIIIVAAIIIYNTLITSRNLFRNAFSQIDVQLKRRYDLVPNLVESAKGYMKFERETLEAVIKARNNALSAVEAASAMPGDPSAMKQLMGADAALTGMLGRLLAVVEQYPDLKSNSVMTRLMEELSSTENRIAFARQAYNDAVMSYNNSRETFPNVLVAGPFGFKEAMLFEVTEPQEKDAVKVSF
jgi:LemA protein